MYFCIHYIWNFYKQIDYLLQMSTNSDNKNTDINLNIDGADNQVDYEDDEVDFPLQDSAVLGADEPQTNSEDAMKELNEKLANAEKNVSQYANTIKV